MAADYSELLESVALFVLKYPVNDFTNRIRRKYRNVAGRVQQMYKAQYGIVQRIVHSIDDQASSILAFRTLELSGGLDHIKNLIHRKLQAKRYIRRFW
ncbi:hypothetical protein D3C81_1675240 [compost metagenome]